MSLHYKSATTKITSRVLICIHSIRTLFKLIYIYIAYSLYYNNDDDNNNNNNISTYNRS